MSKSYVLWVENAPEELDVFRKNIENDGTIQLINVLDAESAVQYLKENFEILSAAVLDIESFDNLENCEEKKSSFFKIERVIQQLIGSGRNNIQYFAFTGKGQYLKKEENFEEDHQCRVFNKGSETVKAQNYLREIVSNHQNTKIKSAYSPAFRIFGVTEEDKPIIKPTYEQLVVDLIEAWDNYKLRNSTLFFGVIRPITEEILNHLVYLGIIPMGIKEWNRKSGYFAKLSTSYPEELPSYIARAFHVIFDVCPEGVHSCPLYDSINSGKTPFLLQSLSHELLNLMSWITDFSASHPDYHENVKHFKLQTPPTRTI